MTHAKFLAVAVAALVFAPAALAAPSGGVSPPLPAGRGAPPPGQPVGLSLPAAAHVAAVPADVVAAHPGGQVLQPDRIEQIDPGQAQAVFARNPGQDLQTSGVHTMRTFARGCWRAYFTQSDNSRIGLGSAEEHVNPLWCGNGSQMGGVDSSWHYEVCTGFVSCNGESGPYLGFGCALYCPEAEYTIYGHLIVYLWYESFEENIAFGLYPSGQAWAYGWEVT